MSRSDSPADTGGGHSSLASHEAAAAELTFISRLAPIQPAVQPTIQHQQHQQLELLRVREEEGDDGGAGGGGGGGVGGGLIGPGGGGGGGLYSSWCDQCWPNCPQL